ncbi:MAG: flippase-like domain-containing protein [Saccharospirillaceae bacterium]|nr:flippase-like domain-containing protein [Saccharospirillaceae bacterium]
MFKSWKFWLGLTFLLALIWLVERSYGWSAVLQSWQSIPPQQVAMAVLFMLLSYLLRALRFYDFFWSAMPWAIYPPDAHYRAAQFLQ